MITYVTICLSFNVCNIYVLYAYLREQTPVVVFLCKLLIEIEICSNKNLIKDVS